MRAATAGVLVVVAVSLPACASSASRGTAHAPQTPATTTPPVELTAQQDHQRLMGLLGITSLRPGPSGNPKAPNAANVDEAKATPYTTLPDPLVMKNGEKVTSATQWAGRRAEIVEDFDREIYGRTPARTPRVRWEVTGRADEVVGDVPVVTKTLVGHVDNSVVSAGRRRHPAHVDDAGESDRPGAGDVELRLRAAPGRRAAAASGARPDLAGAAAGEGVGLRRVRPDQRAARQRRRAHARDHRPGQQGAATKAGRLGRAQGVGVGRQPRARLP